MLECMHCFIKWRSEEFVGVGSLLLSCGSLGLVVSQIAYWDAPSTLWKVDWIFGIRNLSIISFILSSQCIFIGIIQFV